MSIFYEFNNNYVFYSETDTEVIANYIEYILFNNDIDLITIINNLKNIFIGTWGLVIIDCNNPNEYYILRNGSPLVLGMNEKLIMISSETSGLLSLFNNYISIDNNDVIKIDNTDNSYIILLADGHGGNYISKLVCLLFSFSIDVKI